MRVALLALLVGLTGCSLNPLMPDPRTAADRAREIEPHCAGRSEEIDAKALSPAILERVDPAYNYVPSGNDRVVRLRGARLRVRARPNLSVETLQLSVECHQAAVTLGAAQELPHDPYVLPGTWLDIKTDSTGDGFVVAVQVDRADQAREVLARAREFVASAR